MKKPTLSSVPDVDALDVPALGALRASESRYRRLFESTQDGILLLNAETAQIEDANPYLINMLGYSHAEFLGRKLWEVGAFADRVESKKLFATLKTSRYVRSEQLSLKSKAGARIDVEVISNTYDVDGTKVIQCNIRNITDRVQAEAKSQRYAQLYAALSQCTKAILHCRSEDELFLQICRAAVQFGGMKFAWVGLVDDETFEVRSVASFGDSDAYLQGIEISADPASPFGHGPEGSAIRENRPYWCQDFLHAAATTPWRERALRVGLAASAALPLHHLDKVIGVLSLYSSEVQAFDGLARKLLLEMATDINFALDNFHRKAVQEQANREIAYKKVFIETQQETSVDAILVSDENGGVTSYNKQFIKLWALSPQLVSAGTDGLVLQAVINQVENPDTFLARIRYLREHHDQNSHDEIHLTDGRTVDRYSAPVIGVDRKYYGRVWYFRDITESRRIEKELHLAATAFEVQEGIIITNERNTILRVNQAFTRLTGYSAEEVIGRTPALLQSGRHDAKFYQDVWESLTHHHYWQGEIWDRCKNGEVHPFWVTITAVSNADRDVTHYVSTHSDLTQQKKNEAAIHSLAFYDPLTHLPNRRLLLEHLQHALVVSGRNHDHGALLIVNLDKFKRINDTQGHNIGDLWLSEVASRLQACIRPEDTVARLGGDEFVVVLEKLHTDVLNAVSQTHAISDKILAAINQPHSLSGDEYCGSVSVGAALFRGKKVVVDELLKRADSAMHQAKSTGGNTMCFYDPVMQAALDVRAALEIELRHALDEPEFVLYYQAQVDNHEHILGAEVLIRWQHPRRGVVLPMEFVPLAEESGLIAPIGMWVLAQACSQLKAWEADPCTRNLYLAVNVSARQFHQPDFVEQVRRTLETHGGNPRRLKLELTESVVLDNIQGCIVKMDALRMIGVTFSMDDFGTGYSSLSYLTKLPLAQLKIDQSFVRQIGERHRDAVMVQTIIGMAHNLAIEVLAEGVETEEQRVFLEQNGCNHYQGYLFAKPAPIAEFEASLKSRGIYSART